MPPDAPGVAAAFLREWGILLEGCTLVFPDDVPLCIARDLEEFLLLESDLATVARRVGVYSRFRAALAAIQELDASGLHPDGNFCVDGRFGLTISVWYHISRR